MSVIENATRQMEAWANNDSHGYDQMYRWGEKGDYDCSAAVIQAWENAGVPVKSKGATYTGNMLSVFLKLGFKDVTKSINLATGAGLKRGDVLLNTARHTAMYCGNGLEVEASINEKGKATGGVPGDQTGKEFLIRAYRNYPWNYVLRYEESSNLNAESSGAGNAEGGKVSVTANLPILKKGMTGSAVRIWQTILCLSGYDTEIDSSFGPDTEAKTEEFERSKGITDDPNEVGPSAWKAGLELLSAAKTF